MNRYLSILIALAISGCVGTTATGPLPIIVLPSAASGYATATSSVTDDGEFLTASSQVLDIDLGSVDVTITGIETSFVGTDTMVQVTVIYDGVSYDMTWSEADTCWEGTTGDTNLFLHRFFLRPMIN